MELFTEEEYNKSRFSDLLKFQCDYCGKISYTTKREFYKKKKIGHTKHYCSKECGRLSKITAITSNCGYCGKAVTKIVRDYKGSKSGLVFCNHSCSASYTNRHKESGFRRSKFELYAEPILIQRFPKLDFCFNDKKAIESELDIFIPSLNLAFEFNGAIHYKPIFGEEILQKTVENDKEKVVICKERGITLHVVDMSDMNQFVKYKAVVYVSEVISIIEKHLNDVSSSSSSPPYF